MHRSAALVRAVFSSACSHPLPFRAFLRPHNVNLVSIRLAHITAEAVGKMRSAWISAVKKVDSLDNNQRVRAAEASVRDFVKIATSNQKTMLVAIDAVGLIKLCRLSLQPFRIAEIWPHIQSIPLLPAPDERTTNTLIGSSISAALEAKDAATAASIADFLVSLPRVSLAASNVTQLLSALRGGKTPDKVVAVVDALVKGRLGGCAGPIHLNIALQALVDAPREAKMVFNMAGTRQMVR